MARVLNSSHEVLMDEASRITTIVLTGGPCAGKTTLMEKLGNEIDNIPNVKVFFAKEAATLLKQSGINFDDAGKDDTFQKLIIDHQLTAEASARTCALNFAKNNPNYKVIIICDRGIMDGEAYFKKPKDFEDILMTYGLTKAKVYKRYDMVLFLRSAAVGAPQFYTTMDGTPRDESPEKAVELDTGVYNAWRYHPYFKEVDNSFKFYEKLDVAVQYIFEAAGIKVPNKEFKRYVVKYPDFFSIAAMYKISAYKEQCFFLESDKEDQVTFIKTQRKDSEVRYLKSESRYDVVTDDNGEKVRTRVFHQESTISENVFMNLLARLDSKVSPLLRTVFSFTVDYSVRCELELYPHSKKYAIVKFYMDTPSDEAKVKAKFEILAEITSNLAYSKLEIAKRGTNIFAEFDDKT